MILQTQNLTKSFGNRKVVDALNIEVPEGAVYGFLGPNGSGKSTTIRMMTALISPDEGDVFIQGKSVKSFGNKALSQVGALIERADFYQHLSGETNLGMLARMDGTDFSRIQYVLDKTGLRIRGKDKVKTYSQGMKQRLGIAQALLSEPKLLILDEPTNGLDPQGMKEVRELIQELSSEGVTIFISSHLLDEVQKVCSHVAMIRLGKLMTTGKVSDLLTSQGFMITEVEVDQTLKAQNLLNDMEWVDSCKVVDDMLRVSLEKNHVSDLVNILVQNEIQVSAVIPRSTLEDLFLSEVGTESII